MKKWQWLAYPLLVFLLIMVSGSLLFGSTGLWDKISANRKRLQEQSEQASKLRTKLSRLQQANLETESQNLSYLLNISPAQKDLPSLLLEVQQAASVSGAVFDGFKGTVGEVTASTSGTQKSDSLELEVSLFVSSLDQLQQVLQYLENSLPLVKIKEVKLASGKTTLVVEQLWSPLAELKAGADYPVNDISSSLAVVKNEVSGFNTLPVQVIPQNSEVNTNPFGSLVLPVELPAETETQPAETPAETPQPVESPVETVAPLESQ